MQCLGCKKETDRKSGIEFGNDLLCVDCFTKRAQEAASSRPSGAKLKALRKAVKEELAGLLPEDALKQLIEDGYRRILIHREDFDVVSGSMKNQIQVMAGMAVCRRVLEFMRGMSSAIVQGLESEEQEIRDQLKRLSDLDKQ